jgi:hypothetical protein
MTAGDVANAITEIQQDSSAVMGLVTELDPALEAPIGIAELLATLAAKALAAWSASSGTPSTAESVAALMPDQTPLSAPTA